MIELLPSALQNVGRMLGKSHAQVALPELRNLVALYPAGDALPCDGKASKRFHLVGNGTVASELANGGVGVIDGIDVFHKRTLYLTPHSKSTVVHTQRSNIRSGKVGQTMTKFTSLPSRMLHIRERMDWTQKDVARVCEITVSGVSAWERGRVGISTDAANLISKASGFHPEWIKTGNGPMMAREEGLKDYKLSGFTVPLISEVQAGAWGEIIDNFQPGDAEDWIPPTCRVGKRTFALRVTSDSMTNPNGFPSFPEGIILIVDPDVEALNGSFVVVNDGHGHVTFKQLRDDGFSKMLVPLNPRWQNIPFPVDGFITGVVKAAQFVL